MIALAFASAACNGDSEARAHAEMASERAAVSETVSAALPTAGTARVTLTGEGISVDGSFPAGLCGGPYMLGEGVAYQTQAGDWQITVANEKRVSGNVALNEADGSVSVVATANGPGKQFVRGPRNSGSFAVGADFKRAEADLELRPVVGRVTVRLAAVFECDDESMTTRHER